jgi:hypothetical protein
MDWRLAYRGCEGAIGGVAASSDNIRWMIACEWKCLHFNGSFPAFDTKVSFHHAKTPCATPRKLPAFVTALEAEHRLSSVALSAKRGKNDVFIEMKTMVTKTLGVLKSY